MTHLRFPILVLALLAITNISFASGGGGGFRGGGFESGSNARQTDPLYEQGKAIYRGRAGNAKGLEFCLLNDEAETGLVEIKRRNVRPHKGSSYQALADNLRVCSDPEKTITETLNRDETLTLLHYLNKRFRLDLS